MYQNQFLYFESGVAFQLGLTKLLLYNDCGVVTGTNPFPEALQIKTKKRNTSMQKTKKTILIYFDDFFVALQIYLGYFSRLELQNKFYSNT